MRNVDEMYSAAYYNALYIFTLYLHDEGAISLKTSCRITIRVYSSPVEVYVRITYTRGRHLHRSGTTFIIDVRRRSLKVDMAVNTVGPSSIHSIPESGYKTSFRGKPSNLFVRLNNHD